MTQMTQIAQPLTNAGILLSKHSSFIKLFSCYAIIRFTDVEWVVSNRSFGLRKDFWDRHGAKIATRQKVIYGERLFDVFWKLYDTLIIPIWLKFISDFVYLYITKQHVCGTCFIAPYMALFHVLTMGRWVCVFFEEAESCEWELIETLWQNSEIKWISWYSFFTFSTRSKKPTLERDQRFLSHMINNDVDARKV